MKKEEVNQRVPEYLYQLSLSNMNCDQQRITNRYLATVLRTYAQILASLGLQIPAIRYTQLKI
jgi:hypothetical protein